MILPVVRAYAGNAEQFIANFEACRKLDGKSEAQILILTDRGFDACELLDAAHETFSSVLSYEVEPVPKGLSWPTAQNIAWQQAARWVNSGTGGSWLWWEADACPIRKNWLKILSWSHEASGKKFSGVGLRVMNASYMNGVGIYPFNIVESLADCPSLYARNQPFDVLAGPCVMRSFNPIENLIVHKRKALGGSIGVSFSRERFDELLEEYPNAVFFHGASVSLPKIISGQAPKIVPPVTTGRSSFYHSGDFGDIIYSLPAVRELGGGDLRIGPDNRTPMMTREKVTKDRASSIIPLLEAQSYIYKAEYADPMPDETRHDLNQARTLIREGWDVKPGSNLARIFLRAFGLDLENDTQTWLTVPNPRAIAPVVIARSARYRSSSFRWDRIMKEYRGQCVFVGTEEEHSDFCSKFGDVPREKTSNLLELARIIAGADLFIGNQSCPYAIAEGLKKPSILEIGTPANVIFDRENVLHGVDHETNLPALPRRKVSLPKSPFVIRGPVDMFSGFGSLVRNIAVGLSARGHKIAVAPSMVPGTEFQNDIPDFPLEYAKLLVPPQVESHFICSMHCGLPTLIQGGEVVMTMWESTRIAPETRNALNKATRVIVPSTWAATSFNACGVDTPISIVPLGVDTGIYKPSPSRSTRKEFTFGTAGRVAHGGMRKGIDEVIEAFLGAFPKNKNVRLRVKIFKDCNVPKTNDSRIKFDRDFLPNLAGWYQGLDCFVTATRAEGWGLHVHQAMACGVPVIAPQFSALSDFYDDSCGWPVKFRLVPCEGYYEGKGIWAEVNMADLKSKMREAVKSTEIPSFRRAAADRGARFSIANMLNELESILKREGLI